MKKQKVISVIVSAAAALGGLGAVPVSAAGGFEMPENYQFVDIAHHGDTYVAMAKDKTTWTAAKLYTSVDGGMTWSGTRDISNAIISSNNQSQQQLLYWEDKGLFVAHCSGATLTSSDGKTWVSNPNLHYESNGTITVSGDQLIINGTNCLIPTNDTENNKITENKINTMGTSYPWAAAAKPADADGNITVLIQNQNKLCDVVIDIDNIAGSTVSEIESAAAIPNPKDMVYASGADQFLSIDASETLFAAKNSTTYVKLTIKEGTQVTAVAANDNYIVTGFADGTMYYTENTELTSNTAWTEIPSAGTPADEPIRKIELSADNSFVALSNTKVYKGNMSKYNPIDEYVDEHFAISDPYVTGETQENPFIGVKLIGGAYSPTLDTYVVYGTDTATSESKIFTSNDGCATWTSYTADPRHTFTNLRNGAVWWESQGMFVIAAYNADNIGVLYTSEDGYNWTAKGNSDTGYVKGAEIAVGGTSLYTTNASKQFYKYTELSKDSMTNVILSDIKAPDGSDVTLDNKYALTSISVSDSDDPAVFLAGQYLGVTRNNESEAAEETDKWVKLPHIGNANIIDSVYSANSDQFIALVDNNLRTTIIQKDGSSAVQGPVISGGIVLNGIDTNGSDFMFTCGDGKIYTSPDTADFSKENSSLTEVSAVKGDNNTMPATNVFAAEDKFIVTVSDGTDSDVLVAAKNTSSGAYEYKSVSDGIGGGTFEPGGTVKVNVDVDNQMPEGCSFTMIAAIYDPDGRLIQSVTADKTVAEFTNTTETMDVAVGEDVPDGSSMRLFVWNNMQEMTPLTNVTAPF